MKALAVALFTLASITVANARCYVDDPTGTPLNVRTLPQTQGSIVGALHNGVRVRIIDRQNRWVAIVPAIGKSGWVWADYVSCE